MLWLKKSEPINRWVVVFASALMLAVAMGAMVNGISVFFIPMRDEFGWQRGSVALINFFGIVGMALGGILMGRMADRFGTRKVCLFGSVVLGLAFLVASQLQVLWQYYVVFFIAGFFGSAALFAPLLANVGNWFRTKPGLAIGVASAGQALGQGGVPFATAFLIGAFGVQGALGAMGLIALSTLVPLTLLIRQPVAPATDLHRGGLATDEDSPVPISTNAVIVWMGAAVLFCCTTMAVPLIHLVPLIQDRGNSLEDASSVLFLMLLVAIAGRVAFGKLTDMIGAIPAYFLASFWQTALVFMFIQIETLVGYYVFAAIFGFGYAGVMTTLLVCVRVLTPMSRRASALGIVLVFAWFGHAIGGYLGGVLFDMVGNYAASYAVATLAGVVNLIIVGSLFWTVGRGRAVPVAT